MLHYIRLERFATDTQSNLLDQIVSYEEKWSEENTLPEARNVSILTVVIKDSVPP